jgi:hypothetical protein
MVNDPLTSDHHKIIIPDPTTTVRRLLIAPTPRTPSSPPTPKSQPLMVKATRSTCVRFPPHPFHIFCPPFTHSKTSLLLESPYAEVISKGHGSTLPDHPFCRPQTVPALQTEAGTMPRPRPAPSENASPASKTGKITP